MIFKKSRIIITALILFCISMNGAFFSRPNTDIALTGVNGWATLPVAFSNGNGTFDVFNYPITGFAGWAATANVKILPGDFNGDGKTDIALTGGSNWTKLPVAFSNKDGTFKVTSLPIAGFAGWAANTKIKTLTGDFNGDRKTDIAIMGGSNWTTLPVAFSNGNGTFNVTNRAVTGFTDWTKNASVKILTGDFNGDGKTDIALTGVNGWASIPIAFSKGDGTFNVTTYKLADFAGWAAAKNVRILANDFNGDGKTDLALTGVNGWATLPVAFSNGNGTFNVTNQPITNFAGWAATANVKMLTGDFNGDGKTDIVLTGVNGWATLPIAFSNGNGTFTVTNQPVKNFAMWAATPNVRVVTGDFNGDKKRDIALTGVNGWATLPVAFSNGNGTFNVTNNPIAGFAGWAASPKARVLTGNFN
ncbi:MAG TPA: VCBS repeat-containing protein [Candidatus Deferrimicrobium sp.]|nr:VCBS repeat-containing protein [Candidatus Deferrimicrobium sp.]